MTTLTAQRVNGNGRRGRWGTWSGRWLVQDGDATVATGRQHLRERFDIEHGGRSRRLHYRKNKGCVVTDETTGQPVLELRYVALKQFEESAEVTFASGARLHWTLWLRHQDRGTGFYDDAGSPVVTLDHVAPLDTSKPHSTWGYLWRLWFAAADAADHFRITIDSSLAARLTHQDDVLTLALLGIWLDTSKTRRQVNRLASASRS
jgi:hypothetical protein